MSENNPNEKPIVNEEEINKLKSELGEKDKLIKEQNFQIAKAKFSSDYDISSLEADVKKAVDAGKDPSEAFGLAIFNAGIPKKSAPKETTMEPKPEPKDTNLGGGGAPIVNLDTKDKDANTMSENELYEALKEEEKKGNISLIV